MDIRSYDAIDLDLWSEHGRVKCAEARAIAERSIGVVVEPALRELLAA